MPHNASMDQVHPFTFKIEPDPLSERRFRWIVCEGDLIHLRSPQSYATRREAEAVASKAVTKRAVTWPGKN